MRNAESIRDRIRELRRVKASELIANPLNWRRHPTRQREALRGLLREIGYAGALLARETPDGLVLIDGHLRAELTPDVEVPVLVLDVDEHEANTLLATLDPVAAMAETDAIQLRSLMDQVSSGEAGVQALLAEMAEREGIVAAGDPASVQLPEPPDGRYREQYGVIVACESEEHQERVYNDLRSQGYECKVVVT
jgi:hypothetical protein